MTNPVQEALWFVESRSRSHVSLEQTADVCGVSRYHLTRAFAAALGTPLMRYVRRRRLSEAAKELAAGAGDILTVALDCGYSSHEAFTRAFKEEFQLTPEAVRSQGHVNHLILTEPFSMTNQPAPKLRPPRLETLGPLRLAGIADRYHCESTAGIPGQWQRFGPYLSRCSGRVGQDSYGVCKNFGDDGVFDYLAGIEVEQDARLPEGLVIWDLPEQKYAVFHHDGHIAEIGAVISAVWNDALPASGHEAAQGPTLERYGPEFDSATGLGGYEIWVAVN